jgi:hypothetical protein
MGTWKRWAWIVFTDGIGISEFEWCVMLSLIDGVDDLTAPISEKVDYRRGGTMEQKSPSALSWIYDSLGDSIGSERVFLRRQYSRFA